CHWIQFESGWIPGFILYVTVDVRCLWNTSCLLEANFSVGDDVAIYWTQFPEILVHSFSFEADRLKKQNKRFIGRTSLFKENIGKGNASLLLKNVVVGDEGRYMCRVGTLIGASMQAKTLADCLSPVTRIHIHCDGRRLICSSDRIFPRPELRWSTVPALPHGADGSPERNVYVHAEQRHANAPSRRLPESDGNRTR
uniref:Ig-like domain-containing protein n=1 Tax=Hippocampus comes TaxID=109280 RepID=A0A3Q2Z178_HIPCM